MTHQEEHVPMAARGGAKKPVADEAESMPGHEADDTLVAALRQAGSR